MGLAWNRPEQALAVCVAAPDRAIDISRSFLVTSIVLGTVFARHRRLSTGGRKSSVSDSADVVLAYWTEHRQQLRQSENQRAMMTNFILVVVAALSGLMIQQKFSAAAIPLGVLIILIGLFGAIVAAKYHERASYHLSQARALTATLEDMGVLAKDANVDQHRQRHYRVFPRLSRVRLHMLWTGFHLAIAAYGIGLTVVAVLQ